MSFTCGKIPHIWKTKNQMYIPEYTSNDAKTALDNLPKKKSKIFIKIDGSCGAIIKKDGKWTIYQRFFDEKNILKDDCKNYIYTGKNRFYLKPLDKIGESEKNIQIIEELYSSLNTTNKKLDKDFYTIEIAGPNFNRTPGLDCNSIIFHEDQEIKMLVSVMDNCEDWFDFFRNFFEEYPCEGLIICYKNYFYKIHAHKIDKLFSKNYKPPNKL